MHTNTTDEAHSPKRESVSEEHQEDIQFLNDDDFLESSTEIIEEETPPSPYAGLEDLEELLREEEIKVLMEQFEPKSLIDLQRIGLQVKACIDHHMLQQLAKRQPSKVFFKSRDLLTEMVLLIKPFPTGDQKIRLSITPYLKHTFS